VTVGVIRDVAPARGGASLAGKVVLITGGSGTLGSGFATAMAAAGASIVLLARNAERLAATARRIEERGMPVRSVSGDLTDRAGAQRIAEQAYEAFGRLDAVVNSAVPAGAQQPLGDLISTPDEMWQQVYDPIVLGALALAKWLVPRMRDAGGGNFVNICSPTGLVPYPGMDAYGLAKGSLTLLTKYMAREWGQWNIRANALTPGLIVDEQHLTTRALGEDPALAGLLRRTSLGRAGLASELFDVAVFLASDAASFISGAVIPVDGGRF
jgi:NAD(P)-dependent dehydrogenase (short-subunit alcohol dehydrogenase family)